MDNYYQAGDVVYVLFRNPHIPNVAQIQEAAVVKNPDNPDELALFVYETYYPLTNDVVVYSSLSEAEEAYENYFGESYS